MSKDEKPKKEKPLSDIADSMERWFLVAFVLLCLFGLYHGVKDSFSFTTEYFGDKSDHKAYCSKHYTVLEAKTDFAAKKAYKACLKSD